jgi:hypothetical protein
MLSADLAPTVFLDRWAARGAPVELWETQNATALTGLDLQASEPLVATELNVR